MDPPTEELEASVMVLVPMSEPCFPTGLMIYDTDIC